MDMLNNQYHIYGLKNILCERTVKNLSPVLYFTAIIPMMFSSCSEELEHIENRYPTEPVALKVNAGISDSKTRVLSTGSGYSFLPNDEIGISVIAKSSVPIDQASSMWKYRNVPFVNESGQEGSTSVNKFIPSLSGIFLDGSDTYTLAAYYPYLGNISSFATLTIDTKLSQSEKDQIENLIILYTEGTASGNNPTVNFTGDQAFKQKMTKLTLEVSLADDFYIAEGYEEITDLNTYLEKCSPILKGLNHTGIFDPSDGSITLEGEASDDDWDIVGAGMKGWAVADQNSRKYSVVLLPQNADNLNVKIKDPYGTVFGPVDMPKINFESGKHYIYQLTMQRNSLLIAAPTIEPWVNNQLDDIGTIQGEEV